MTGVKGGSVEEYLALAFLGLVTTIGACRPVAPELGPRAAGVGHDEAGPGGPSGGRMAGSPCVVVREGTTPEAFAKMLASDDGRLLYVQGLPILPDFASSGLERVETLVLHDVLLPDLAWLERLPLLRELVLDHVRGGEAYRKWFAVEAHKSLGYDVALAPVLLAFDPQRAALASGAGEEVASDWQRHVEEWGDRIPDATLLGLDEVLSGLPVLPNLERLRVRIAAMVARPMDADWFEAYMRTYEDAPPLPPSLWTAARQPNLRELHLDMSGGWLSLEAGPELRLERLEIRNAYVMSLEPLTSQPTLRHLGLTSMVGLGTDPGGEEWFQAQPAMDLSALSAVSWLRELHVVNSSVRDLSFIAALTGLETLDLQWSQVDDLSALGDGARPCAVNLVGIPPHPYRESEHCENACCRAGDVEHRLVTEPANCKASCGARCEVNHHCTWKKQPEVVLPWKLLWSDELSAGLTGLNLVEVPCEP